MMYLISLQYYYIKQTKISRTRSGGIIDSVINHNINISKYDPLAGTSYIKLPKEPSKKKNLYPAGCITRITKADENFAKRLDLKDIKFPVKTRDIHKIEKK